MIYESFVVLVFFVACGLCGAVVGDAVTSILAGHRPQHKALPFVQIAAVASVLFLAFA